MQYHLTILLRKGENYHVLCTDHVPGSWVSAFTCHLSFMSYKNPWRLALFSSFFKCVDTFDASRLLERSSLKGFFKRSGMDCSGPSSLPKIAWWKSKLCQGTLNPFSGKEHVLIRNSQCSLWPFWAVRSDSLGVSCPAARQRVDEQLRHTDEQPGLIQAAVCNSLPGPIQDFLQKYHFTAAGWLDFANCLTSGCTGSFSR